MAGATNARSPFHEKGCVAGSAILGGVVGSWAPVPVAGTLTGAAVGAVIGIAICSRDSISKPIGSFFEIDKQIKDLSSNFDTQKKAIEALVNQGFAKDKNSAAIMLQYALIEVKKNPKQAYADLPKMPRTPSGHAAHGLSRLARKTDAAAAAVV